MKKLSFILLFLISQFAYNQTYTWTTLPSPPSTSGRYDDVFFLDENLGWAARGGNGMVYKTTNGGSDWVQQVVNAAAPNEYYRNIEFLNENIGFLGTLNGHFYKTINGGNTWEMVTITPNPPAICGLDCIGTSTIYGCGAWFGPAYIIKSIDSGQNWQFIDMSSYANMLVEVLFVDENLGFASGSKNDGAIILKTTDGGLTWSEIFTSTTPNEYVWKMQLLNGDINKMFCSIEAVAPSNGKILKTLDGGSHWTMYDFPDPYVQAVGFVSETHGWMGGHHTGFYETFDGGITWTNNNIGGALNRIFFIGNIAYAAGNNIYKMTTQLSNSNIESPTDKKLAVKVVNPITSNKLELKVNFEHSDHILISLYTVEGKFIKFILQDNVANKLEKNYSIDFNYPSGIYLLDIHSNLGRQSIKIINP